MAKSNNNKGSRKNQRASETGSQSSALQSANQRQSGLERREELGLSSPFGFLRRFGEEMDRLFEDFGFGRGSLAPTFASGLDRLNAIGNSMWSPQVEVIERDNQLLIRADLPGLTSDDIDVDISDDTLVIRGERRDESEEEVQGRYHTERSYGSFYRRIPLPTGIDVGEATADFHNGVLEIQLPAPQRQEQKQRRLEIREGKTAGYDQPRAKAKAAGAK
jgi:HSP20 family protein